MAEKLDCVFEEHHQNICDVKQTHYCDHSFECEISDYEINQEGYAALPTYLEPITPVFETKSVSIKELFFQEQIIFTSKRGPPSLT